jgi:hypothetical protein
MMRLVVVIFLTVFARGIMAQSNETIILSIDGKEYTFTEGEELKLKETFVSPKISVRLADNKKFESNYLTFEYPKNFSYTFEEDIGFRNWTLDGSDFVIMYFEMDIETELSDFVDEMVNQFGAWRCETSPTKLKLGDRTLEGTRIDVTLVGQKLTIDFVEIESNEYKSRIIAFQDSVGEDGNGSEEKTKTLKVIDNTILYK